MTNDQGLAATQLVDNPAVVPVASATWTACNLATVPAANCGSVIFNFTDNLIVNGAGADFTIFEINIPNNLRVTIDGVAVTLLSTATGFQCPARAEGRSR